MTPDPAREQQTHSGHAAPRSEPQKNRLIWAMLGAFLVLNVPIFVCQHLTADTVIYDLQAKCALSGGVLYRDMVEPNLPGVVWTHMIIRTLAGWSSEVMRFVDLLILSAIIFLAGQFIRAPQEQRFGPRMALFALFVSVFYLGLSEWCHCQRDTWMLLPSLAALQLRAGRERLSVSSSFSEGCLWGIAFWLKPHVAIPAIAVLTVDAFVKRCGRESLIDLGCVIGGGLAVGVAGSIWLIQTGAWEPFWIMQLEWNPEYLKAGRDKFDRARLLSLWRSFLPWGWAHVGAIPVAGIVVGKQLQSLTDRRRLLLAALYFGWTCQAFAVQHPFMYVHVPALILAMAVIASGSWTVESQPLTKLVMVLVVLQSSLLSPARLSNWWTCVEKGSTLSVRAKIQRQPYPDWEHLEPVIQYLQRQQVKDGEVTVYTGTLIHLYQELGIRPSTRYTYVDVLARLFKTRVDAIEQSLAESEHRYVVSSLLEAGVSIDEIDGPIDPRTQLPVAFPVEAFEQFPYTQPVIFRSGPYLVHRVDGDIGSLSTEYFPLARQTKANGRKTVAVFRSDQATE